MKYITLNGTRLYPFPADVSHDVFFRTVAQPGDVCTGAGFIYLGDDGEPECYGRSESLDIDAQPARDTLLAEIVFMAARRKIAC